MKTSNPISLGFSLALLISSAAAAAPSVSGVSGTPSNGQTIRISGSGFGAKSPAAPYLWADFENGINPSSLGQKTSWDQIGSMTWAAGEGYRGGGAAKASDSSGNWTLATQFDSWSREGQKSYIYRRTRQNFVVTDISQNWKTWRAWAESGKPNIYIAANIGRAFVEYVGGDDSAFWGEFNPATTNWITEEIRMRASSAINVKDGELTYRVDGVDKASGSILTRSSAAPDYIVMNFAVHFVLANVELWSPAWNSNNRVWADSVYVDTSWAHVMIGDGPTWTSCKNLDIQIPTAWADGSVSVVTYTPSFSSGSKAYVYVTDPNGVVNSNGFAITVGQGNAPSNVAPSVSAGSDQTITLGTVAQLNGTGSDDGLPTPPGALTYAWTKISGPSGSQFGSASSRSTSVSFTAAGTYVFRLTGNDGALTNDDDVQVTVQAPAAVNTAPNASAGSDAIVVMGANAQLSGTATDDGLPASPGALTYAWSKVSGPAGTQFTSGSSRNTAVSFQATGTYIFRLTVSDGQLSDTDDVQIIVQPGVPVNQAPTADAGSDAKVILGTNVQLNGTGTDDGLPTPPGSLTYSWTQVSGPSGAQVISPRSRSTAVSFTKTGTYVFRLSASDGTLSDDDDVQVTVQTPPTRPNAAPLVNAGGDQTIFLPGKANLSASATDDGVPGGGISYTWSLKSGPGSVSFGTPTASATTASFLSAGAYVLTVEASDGEKNSSDDISITVRPPSATDVVDGGQAASSSGAETPKNVFNPAVGETARLPYVLKGPGSVKVVIFDRGGRQVKELFDEQAEGGTHLVRWDGRNDDGSIVASGLYFALLTGSEGSRGRQKVAVIK